MQFVIDVLQSVSIIALVCSVISIAKAVREVSLREQERAELDRQFRWEIQKTIRGENLYRVVVKKRSDINQAEYPTLVSFRLFYHDWLILEKSDAWHQLEELLWEARSKRTQKYHQDLE